jgi:hypothetical protein
MEITRESELRVLQTAIRSIVLATLSAMKAKQPVPNGLANDLPTLMTLESEVTLAVKKLESVNNHPEFNFSMN